MPGGNRCVVIHLDSGDNRRLVVLLQDAGDNRCRGIAGAWYVFFKIRGITGAGDNRCLVSLLHDSGITDAGDNRCVVILLQDSGDNRCWG